MFSKTNITLFSMKASDNCSDAAGGSGGLRPVLESSLPGQHHQVAGTEGGGAPGRSILVILIGSSIALLSGKLYYLISMTRGLTFDH